MNESAYRKTESNLYEHYQKVVHNNMKQVTYNIRKEKLREEYSDDTIVDIDASFDGSWQKRGYSSLNGVTTGIAKDSGQCFDYRVFSKKCSACRSWQKKKGTPEYDRFIANHHCAINFEGSAGAMELSGVIETFKESVALHKVRITNFIGDGDCKSYQSVVAADPYPGTVIQKLEYVGHVQKRCGTRLRSLKKVVKIK